MLNKAELQQVVDEVVKRLFGIIVASEASSDGVGLSEGIENENRGTTHGALPGFSSGISVDDELYGFKKKDGGYSLISLSHISNEQDGDRSVWTSSDLVLKLRGEVLYVCDSSNLTNAFLKIDISDGTVKLGDISKFSPPNAANPLASTELPVVRHGDGIMLGGSAFPSGVVATSTKVTSS